MRHALIAVTIALSALSGCTSSRTPAPPDASPRAPKAYVAPTPPPMPPRAIAAPTSPPPGEQVTLDDQGVKFILFLPPQYRPTDTPDVRDVPLTIHFHTAPWFAIQEHLRHGLKTPLIAWYAGEGSSKYRAPFEDRARLRRWIDLVEGELRRRRAPVDVKVTSIDVSSFSAGYGAVREIVKSPEYLRLLRRVVLCDSMYASFEGENTPHPTTQPAKQHIEPWVPLARAAARGEKTFVVTFSQVPTETYASSSRCAEALVGELGGQLRDVPRGSVPATLDPEFPLKTRCDIGHFHAWGYGGSDAPAHLTHARHLADLWDALDAVGAP